MTIEHKLTYPFVIKIATSSFVKLGHVLNVHETASASTANNFAEDCDFCSKFNEGLGVPILMTHGYTTCLASHGDAWEAVAQRLN